MKHIKLYKVIFNYYINNNEISSAKYNEFNKYVGEDGKEISINNVSYLYIPNPFIIKEDEIEKYKKYGCGYKSLEYIGSLLEE